MNSLIFLTKKCDESVKARVCANGSAQCNYITKQEATSPTVTTYTLITTCVINAKQGRDIITLDIHNTLIQTLLPQSDKRIIIKN